MVYVTCELLYEGIPLCGNVISSFQPFEDNILFNQWLYTPIKYKDLPLNTKLLIKIWDTAAPGKKVVIGQTEITLFSPTNRHVKEGIYKFKLQNPNIESPPSNPSSALNELDRLEKVF